MRFAEDRKRHGFTIGQAAWRLGVKPLEYQELEDRELHLQLEAWDGICKLCGSQGLSSRVRRANSSNSRTQADVPELDSSLTTSEGTEPWLIRTRI
jgi:hypothetical protein